MAKGLDSLKNNLKCNSCRMLITIRTTRQKSSKEGVRTSQPQQQPACLSGCAQRSCVEALKYFVQNVIGQVHHTERMRIALRGLTTSHLYFRWSAGNDGVIHCFRP